MTYFTEWGNCNREFLGESSSTCWSWKKCSRHVRHISPLYFKRRTTALFVWGEGKRCKYWCGSLIEAPQYMLLSIAWHWGHQAQLYQKGIIALTMARAYEEALNLLEVQCRIWAHTVPRDRTGESFWASQYVGSRRFWLCGLPSMAMASRGLLLALVLGHLNVADAALASAGSGVSLAQGVPWRTSWPPWVRM